MNEAADSSHSGLQGFYEWVEKATRSVGREHILFLDGNTYSMDFSGFKTGLPNGVYAMHDYATMGFSAITRYEGADEQKDNLRRQYETKFESMREHKVPVSIIGIFVPVIRLSEFLTASIDLEWRIRTSISKFR